MNQVRVEKDKLLAILKKNREEHRQIFLDAQKKYRERAIQVLDEQLTLARDGSPFVLHRITELVSPSDHTSDYDRAIQMLELSVEGTVVLTAADFSNLVQDQWSWSRQWAASNSRYVDSPKFRSILDEE